MRCDVSNAMNRDVMSQMLWIEMWYLKCYEEECGVSVAMNRDVVSQMLWIGMLDPV